MVKEHRQLRSELLLFLCLPLPLLIPLRIHRPGVPALLARTDLAPPLPALPLARLGPPLPSTLKLFPLVLTMTLRSTSVAWVVPILVPGPFVKAAVLKAGTSLTGATLNAACVGAGASRRTSLPLQAPPKGRPRLVPLQVPFKGLLLQVSLQVPHPGLASPVPRPASPHPFLLPQGQ